MTDTVYTDILDLDALARVVEVLGPTGDKYVTDVFLPPDAEQAGWPEGYDVAPGMQIHTSPYVPRDRMVLMVRAPGGFPALEMRIVSMES